MLCERCGKNEANVQVQAFSVDGQSRTFNLCTECVAKQRAEFGREGADFAKLMGSLLGKLAQRAKADEDKFEAVCPACGESYSDFRSTGLMGCEKCYTAFAEKVEEILIKRNDSARYAHDGADAAESRRVSIRRLRGRMKTAIESEDYEQAARLRDEIRELEKQL